MFLREHIFEFAIVGFPRVRGDVPNRSSSSASLIEFSPRARGCSFVAFGYHIAEKVFPACAGMFLPATQNTIRLSGFPRVRGDVPQGVPGTKDLKRFSPRARGCSHINFIFHQIWVVFPACAGMFPNRYHPDGHARCFPRVRGDVPLRKN